MSTDRLNDRFNLPELDPISPNLDLIICSAQEFDGAVRTPTRKIACPVHALPGPSWVDIAKGTRDKTRCRQAWPTDVASRKACSCHIEFTHTPLGHGLKLRIQDKQSAIPDRMANGRCVIPVFPTAYPVGDINGGLSRAV